MLDSCNIYGTFLYKQKIYTPPECYTDTYDFMVSVHDYNTSALLSDIQWSLYRRDSSVSEYGLVDETHIYVASGTSATGIVYLNLADYGLRTTSTDYYLKSWKNEDNIYIAGLRIKYYASDYITNDSNAPYLRDTLQISQQVSSGGTSVGGGGMGGSIVTHTEYRDKPLPAIRVMAINVGDEIEDKEIIITNIKDFDSL